MRELITQRVREFYQALPFNKCGDISSRSIRIRANALKSNYPDLNKILCENNIKSVIEVGCGTGWLSNTLAFNYNVNVLGVDFSEMALVEAQALCTELALSDNLKFVEADLFGFRPSKQFDLLVSLGVLHHTFDVPTALDAVEKFIRPGGYIYLGLYHTYGRKIFLEIFKEMIELYGEEKAFDHFMKISGKNQQDITFQRSWFRDQVCHVHESQHTFAEVSGWLSDRGFRVESTSLNGFNKIKSLSPIFEFEEKMAEVSYRRNHIEKTYFPGFFTVAAQKRSA